MNTKSLIFKSLWCLVSTLSSIFCDVLSDVIGVTRK